MEKRQLITVYTAMLFDEDKDFVYESKGFLTESAALDYGHEVLLGPDGDGAIGVKYVSVAKYYKLED
jgi:hypothetical protein